jgi:hypothetical protein
LDAKFLEAAPLKHYRDTLPDDENKLEKGEFVCAFFLVFGSRLWAHTTQ